MMSRDCVYMELDWKIPKCMTIDARNFRCLDDNYIIKRMCAMKFKHLLNISNKEKLYKSNSKCFDHHCFKLGMY